MLTIDQKRMAERLLGAFCDRKYPAHVRQHARPEIVWERGALTLYERRPPWRADLGPVWSRNPIARFRHTPRRWTLYCSDRNGKWHAYSGPTKAMGPRLRDLDNDATGIFWG